MKTATVLTRATLVSVVFLAAQLSAQTTAAVPVAPAKPDDAPKDEDVLKLDSLVVIGSLAPRSKMENPRAITTIDRTQLDDKQPRSIVDGIKLIPSFYIESSAGEGNGNLFARGLQSSGGFAQVALQEDGLPVFSEFDLPFAGGEAWSRFDTFTANIESVRGGAAEILQGNATGGVINLISREGTPTAQGEVMLQAGDFGLFRTDVWASGPLGKNTTFAVGGFYGFDDGLRSPGFVADKGGQFHVNVRHDFQNGKGYFKVSGKAQYHSILNGVPIPVLNTNGSPSSIPGGPDIRTSTNTSVDTAVLSLGNTPAGVIQYDSRDGFKNSLWYVGTELNYEIADGLRVINLNRYSYVDRPTITVNNTNIPLPWQTLANNIATSANAKGQFAAALANGNYNYSLKYTGTGAVAAADPAAATGLNTNGLGIISGYNFNGIVLHNFQNDLRLIKSFNDDKTQISAGLYLAYLQQDEFRVYNNYLSDVSPTQRRIDIVFLDATTNQPIGQGTNNGLTQEGNNYLNAGYSEKQLGAYASLQHKWGKWNFDLGVRRDQIDADGDQEKTQVYYYSNGAWVPGAIAAAPAGTNPALVNAKFGTGGFVSSTFPKRAGTAYSGAANYSINSAWALFASYSRGFRLPRPESYFSGNITVPFNPVLLPTEHADQYELGTKYSGKHVALFLTGFYVKDADVFASAINFNSSGGIVTQNTVTSTEATGAELEAQWTPIRGLSINPVYTYQEMTYTSDTLMSGTVNGVPNTIFNLNGLRPVRIPKLQGQLNVSYALPRTDWGELRFTGAWRYVGERALDAANSASIKAFSEFEFGAAFTTKNSLTFRVQVANAFNSDGLTENDPRVTVNPLGKYLLVRPVLPRSIVASVAYKF